LDKVLQIIYACALYDKRGQLKGILNKKDSFCHKNVTNSGQRTIRPVL